MRMKKDASDLLSGNVLPIPGKWLMFALILCAGVGLSAKPVFKTGFQKKNASQHRLSNQVQLRNTGYQASRIVVVLGYPQSNHYQEVANFQPTAGGRLLKDPKTGNQYVQFVLTGSNLPAAGATTTIGYNTDVTLYELEPDLKKYPGNRIQIDKHEKDAVAIKKSLAPLTLANMPYVDPANRRLQKMSTSAWLKNSRQPLSYASWAYKYVAREYVYRDANTGIHPLSQILSQNGGDCGNLSSIYVSLLRSRKIPARHLVGIRADGVYHAWAEFYDYNNGWIPVDVTYKNSNPRGNYFGHIAARDKAIILHHDLNIAVELEPGRTHNFPLLQGFGWWVWGNGDIQSQLHPTHQINVQNL